MEIISLLKPQDLKQYITYLNDNIDDGLLWTAVLEAQDIDLQYILGKDLYQKILNDYDDEILDGEYKVAFEDYILKAAIYFSLRRAIKYMIFKFNNKNIGVKSSDNTSPVIDMDYIKYLDTTSRNNAEFYQRRLVEFLEDSDIKEYKNKCDVNINKNGTSMGGIFLC